MSVLSLHNRNPVAERSLSDSKNTLMKGRVILILETLIGLCRMKEYARSTVGAHCIHVSDKMLEGIAAAKRKDDKIILQEEKAQKLPPQNFKNIKEKEKDKEEAIKEAAKLKKILEQKEQSF